MMANQQEELYETLNNLGYNGEYLQTNIVNEILESNIISKPFCSLITWLTNELGTLLKLDEQVHLESEGDDFLLELSSLLKELHCPYSRLVSGSTLDRLKSEDDRILLFQFLTTELMAAKMSHHQKPNEKLVIEVQESPAAHALKSIMQNFQLGKPPQGTTSKVIFDRIIKHLNGLKKSWEQPLFIPSQPLTCEEWTKLEKLQHELDAEYELRCEMLRTRLEVTIQSFQWNNDQEKNAFLAKLYEEKLNEIDFLSKETGIADLLAARPNLLIIQKTSSALVRKNTHSQLEKHIIGRVPDRGGRANEHQIPAPEMPQWQKNRSTGGGGGGGGGNRGGNQGGHYRGQNPQQQRNFHQSNYQPQGSNQNTGNYNRSNYQNNQQDGGDHQQHRSHNNRGGRVQGGWNQSGGGNRAGNQSYQDHGNQNYQQADNYQNRANFSQQQDQDNNRDGGNYSRGKSNYNRGGRR